MAVVVAPAAHLVEVLRDDRAPSEAYDVDHVLFDEVDDDLAHPGGDEGARHAQHDRGALLVAQHALEHRGRLPEGPGLEGRLAVESRSCETVVVLLTFIAVSGGRGVLLPLCGRRRPPRRACTRGQRRGSLFLSIPSSRSSRRIRYAAMAAAYPESMFTAVIPWRRNSRQTAATRGPRTRRRSRRRDVGTATDGPADQAAQDREERSFDAATAMSHRRLRSPRGTRAARRTPATPTSGTSDDVTPRYSSEPAGFLGDRRVGGSGGDDRHDASTRGIGLPTERSERRGSRV